VNRTVTFGKVSDCVVMLLNLNFVLVELQMIVGHPVMDQSDAVTEVSHHVRVIRGQCTDVDLCVVSI